MPLLLIRPAWQDLLGRYDFKPVASVDEGESAALSRLPYNAASRLLAELCYELQLEPMQLPRVCKHADATSVDIPVVNAIHIISIECASLDLASAAAWLHRELILPGRAIEDTPKPALPKESLFGPVQICVCAFQEGIRRLDDLIMSKRGEIVESAGWTLPCPLGVLRE